MLSRFEEKKIQEKCGVKISSLKISLHVFFDKGLWLCIVSRKAAQVRKSKDSLQDGESGKRADFKGN